MLSHRSRCRHAFTTRSPLSQRHGYILLISILAIGVISSAVVSSLMFLGTSAGQISLAIQQSTQAMGLAQACSEYALTQLRNNPQYAGNDVVQIGNGTCDIYLIGGIGNNNRLLCIEGVLGDTYRRLEIVVKEVLPKTTITSWQEVTQFSLCST